jgi:glycosyltransferase involved in cell wall biosynthesis
MTVPVVSVIIPAYNCGAYLGKTLANALEQTGVSFEVVLIDNSTDDSCRGYADHPDSRVRYVFVQPPGVAAARNLGIRLARGKFLAFLDADDEWLPEKLSMQVSAFEKFPEAGLVFTDTMMCSDEEIFQNAMYTNVLKAWCQDHRSEVSDCYFGSLYARLLNNNCMHTSSVMVRRTILDQTGVFDERVQVVKISEDYDLWLRIAQGHPIVYIDRVFCKYKVVEEGFSGGMAVRGLRWLDAQIAVREKHRRAGWIPAEHVDLLNDVLSKRYWALGRSHFGYNRLREARKCFWESLRARPFNLKIWLYWCCSFLPEQVVDVTRSIRRSNKEKPIDDPHARH